MFTTQILNSIIEVVAPDNEKTADLVYPIPYGTTTPPTTKPSGTTGPILPWQQCIEINFLTIDEDLCLVVDFTDCDVVISVTLATQRVESRYSITEAFFFHP